MSDDRPTVSYVRILLRADGYHLRYRRNGRTRTVPTGSRSLDEAEALADVIAVTLFDAQAKDRATRQSAAPFNSPRVKR